MPLSRSAAPECTSEPQAEGREDQDDAHVYHQPSPEVVPEERDVDSHHYAHKRKHVDHDGDVPAHAACLSVGALRMKVLCVLRSP